MLSWNIPRSHETNTKISSISSGKLPSVFYENNFDRFMSPTVINIHFYATRRPMLAEGHARRQWDLPATLSTCHALTDSLTPALQSPPSSRTVNKLATYQSRSGSLVQIFTCAWKFLNAHTMVLFALVYKCIRVMFLLIEYVV